MGRYERVAKVPDELTFNEYIRCKEYRVPPRLFLEVKRIVNKYCHMHFNFIAEPAPFESIVIKAYKKDKSFRITNAKALSLWMVEEEMDQGSASRLEEFIDHTIRWMIEDMNHYLLVRTEPVPIPGEKLSQVKSLK